MDKRRVIEAPGGYGERVQLALRSAGRVSDIARACGVSELYVYQARSGHRGWSEPSKLAAACGVPEVLLVYGPTSELAAAMERKTASPGTWASDDVEYDRLVEALVQLPVSVETARVNPLTLDLLKREESRRHGSLTVRLPGGAYVFAGVEVEPSPSVPVGHVMAVPVVVPVVVS